MGVVIPQVLTEDKVSGAQIVDGSLKFDEDNNTVLERTNTRSAANAAASVSVWVKRSTLSSSALYTLLQYESGGTFAFSLTLYNDYIYVYDSTGSDLNAAKSNGVLRDPSAWYHVFYSRSNGGTDGTLYINGVEQSKKNSSATSTDWFAYEGQIGYRKNGAIRYYDGFMSQLYVIDGQQLSPSDFGFTDPLTNTWRPKKYTGTFGDMGYYLPFDGNSPIGQDQSGRGNNWTPVNFGGSNTIEKATGALPILNTDGGGKVARVGVRTDSNASSLVLALPLVGIKSDFSNAINSGTSNKAITANGNAAASSAQSNFYGGSFVFDGTGDYLSIPSSSDFAFGTGDFTIEFHSFFAASSLPANATFYSNNYTGTQGVLVQSSSAALYFYVASSSVYTGNVLVAQKWQHIAITRSSGTISIFVDGVLQASGTLSGSAGNSSVGVTIAAGSNGGTGFELNGYIQDLRIYKGLAKYTQNFIPASTDPDILPDTPSGVAYSSNVALVPSTDGAVAFDGSGDYLDVPYSTDFVFGTGDFTIERFIYFNTLPDATYGGGHMQLGLGVNGTDAYSSWYWSFGQSSMFLGRYDGSSTTYANFTIPPITTGKWYHAAFCRSGSTIYGFIDGVLIGSTSISANITAVNTSDPLRIGRYRAGNSNWDFNGFNSNIHIVKGTALYTSNFTPPTAPLASVANTKLLCCKSNSSATAFDVSPGTITSVNALATNFNPFTVNINAVRGQESGYCTWNPLSASSTTLSNGNLDFSMVGGTNTGVRATTAIPLSGKWYYEVDIVSVGEIWLGLQPQTVNSGSNSVYYRYDTGGWQNIYINGSQTAAVPGYTNGDVIGCGYDADNQQIRWYKNGVQVGTNYSLTNTGNLVPWIGHGSAVGSASGRANFGQKPFKFPPPSGFQPLALANTPRPTIVRPDQYVGIVTYTGDSVDGRVISLPFKADMVMVKVRNQTGQDWVLGDSVRGSEAVLNTNQTYSETSPSNYGGVGFSVPLGFTLEKGQDAVNGHKQTNENTWTYAAWAWKAGGNSNTFNVDDVGYATASAAGLTAGTITPTGASVNTKSGFSIVTYTGTRTSNGVDTVGHGLNIAPSLVITKSRSNTSDWAVQHISTTDPSNILFLQLTNAETSVSTYGALSRPTSSVFSVNYTSAMNVSGYTYVAYCFAPVAGYSAFGSYTGNGSADGPFVYTGFRPRYVLQKKTSDVSAWAIRDAARDPYNASNTRLWTNFSSAESSADAIDILSNGFKVRNTDTDWNANGATYIYAAFAESPSFNLYGAQSNAR